MLMLMENEGPPARAPSGGQLGKEVGKGRGGFLSSGGFLVGPAGRGYNDRMIE